MQEISRRKPILKNRVDPAIEKAVISFTIDKPAYGQHRVSNELGNSGKHCFGKTLMQTFLDNKHIAIQKQLDRTHQTNEPILAAV